LFHASTRRYNTLRWLRRFRRWAHLYCHVGIDPIDGRITKMKASVPDDRLGKMGFILEGEDWVAVEWDFCTN